jgi:hypothetical protein
MMPDDRDTANARTKLELAELIGLVGNAYTREGLSPPSQLYRAVDFWRVYRGKRSSTSSTTILTATDNSISVVLETGCSTWFKPRSAKPSRLSARSPLYSNLKPDDQHCEHAQDDAQEDAARDDHSRHAKDTDLHGVALAAFGAFGTPPLRVWLTSPPGRRLNDHLTSIALLC